MSGLGRRVEFRRDINLSEAHLAKKLHLMKKPERFIKAEIQQYFIDDFYEQADPYADELPPINDEPEEGDFSDIDDDYHRHYNRHYNRGGYNSNSDSDDEPWSLHREANQKPSYSLNILTEELKFNRSEKLFKNTMTAILGKKLPLDLASKICDLF
jgi:hypothetical protein